MITELSEDKRFLVIKECTQDEYNQVLTSYTKTVDGYRFSPLSDCLGKLAEAAESISRACSRDRDHSESDLHQPDDGYGVPSPADAGFSDKNL